MNKNINEIIERDWGEDEMDAVDERRRALWALALVAVLILGLVVAMCLVYCKCRELKATERARTALACPSGTAQRVVDEVDQEPFVRVCNAVSDVVLGK